MSVLSDLEPASVWRAFEEISSIPRCSKDEGRILAFLEAEAGRLGLKSARDGVGNLVVRKPASPGRETRPGVILQGHVDMVCEQNRGTNHDFTCEGVELERRGDWLGARGTTLGADNGIAVAYMLALLREPSAVHPPLECLFTVDEESALTGALQLDPRLLTGRLLINLDSEDEGRFTIGCAGGSTAWGTLPVVHRPAAAQDGPFWQIALTGLPGGHSGVNIHEARGNAVALLARFLNTQRGRNYGLVSFQGGDKHNALPREAFAVLCGGRADTWAEACAEAQALFRAELPVYGGGLTLSVSPWSPEGALPGAPDSEGPGGEGPGGSAGPGSLPGTPRGFSSSGLDGRPGILTDRSRDTFLDLLVSLPHGPATYSPAVPGLVESSSNLAAVRLGPGGAEILTSQRSDRLSRRLELCARTEAVFRLAGGTIRFGDAYPAWTPRPDSPLLARCLDLWKRRTGRDALVEVIHAGLECGVIGDKIPGLDMISYGPDIRGAHTPGEELRLASAASVWAFTLALLEEL